MLIQLTGRLSDFFGEELKFLYRMVEIKVKRNMVAKGGDHPSRRFF